MRGRPGVHALGRYGVFLCPECGEPFSKEAKIKRTRCPRCGKSVNVQKLFALYRTDDPRKAAEGVRFAGLTEHKKGKAASAHREIESSMAKGAKARHDFDAFTAAIEELEGVITLDRLEKELEAFKPEELEKYLARAIEEGFLVACKGGFKVVR